MELIGLPKYQDLFDGPEPNLKDLLADIPSMTILNLVSVISAEIHLSSDRMQDDTRILEFMLRRQPITFRVNFYKKLNSLVTRERPIGIFAQVYLLKWMHYELCNYRNLELEDTSPEQEINILKAYCLVVHEETKIADQTFETNRLQDGELFFTHSWPILLDQLEASHVVNPIIEMTRGAAFLNYLEHESNYKSYLQEFLLRRGKQGSWNYLLDICQLMMASWERGDMGMMSGARFSIGKNEDFSALLDSFSIRQEAYLEKYASNHRNFTGLKECPLLKQSDGGYIVLNWNFLAAKLYDGLLFDLYNFSGIKKEFKNFPAFKQHISENVTERFLFQKLMSACLTDKHSVLLFDDGKRQNGFPDGYYRPGNKLILLEIKDAMFPANTISSRSFQTMKETLDTKFNQSHKGVGQLISQIKKIQQGPMEVPQKYKKAKNLRIYPVIIYTDHFFGMPGVNEYLNTEFQNRLSEEKLNDKFSKIHPLTMIDLKFFIGHINYLIKEGNELYNLIEHYHCSLKRARTRHLRSFTLEQYMDTFSGFGLIASKEFKGLYHKSDDYVKIIVEVLKLIRIS